MAQFDARYRSDLRSAREARVAVATFLRSRGVGAEILEDIETALGEALANAVEHGHVPGASFAVSATIDGDRIALEVKDRGRGFEPLVTRPRVEAMPMRGFGLSIMRQLMDEVTFLDRGTRLRLVKRLHAQREAEMQQS